MVSWLCAIGTTSARLVSPTVGLIPTTPLIDAGQTIEPSVSVPEDDRPRRPKPRGRRRVLWRRRPDESRPTCGPARDPKRAVLMRRAANVIVAATS
jgi:hypothetical protein